MTIKLGTEMKKKLVTEMIHFGMKSFYFLIKRQFLWVVALIF